MDLPNLGWIAINAEGVWRVANDKTLSRDSRIINGRIIDSCVVIIELMWTIIKMLERDGNVFVFVVCRYIDYSEEAVSVRVNDNPATMK